MTKGTPRYADDVAFVDDEDGYTQIEIGANSVDDEYECPIYIAIDEIDQWGSDRAGVSIALSVATAKKLRKELTKLIKRY